MDDNEQKFKAFFDSLYKSVSDVEQEVKRVNSSGGQIFEVMQKGPSTLYKDYNYAKQVSENPELVKVEAYVKDIVEKAFKKNV